MNLYIHFLAYFIQGKGCTWKPFSKPRQWPHTKHTFFFFSERRHWASSLFLSSLSYLPSSSRGFRCTALYLEELRIALHVHADEMRAQWRETKRERERSEVGEWEGEGTAKNPRPSGCNVRLHASCGQSFRGAVMKLRLRGHAMQFLGLLHYFRSRLGFACALRGQIHRAFDACWNAEIISEISC